MKSAALLFTTTLAAICLLLLAAMSVATQAASPAAPSSPSGAGPYSLHLLVSAPSQCPSCSIYVDLDSDPGPAVCDHIYDVPDTGGVERDLVVTLRTEANPHLYWLGRGDHGFTLRGTSEQVVFGSGYVTAYCGTAFDFARIKASFGTKAGNPAFEPRADLNNDGQITIGDFLLMRAFYGLC